MIMLQKLTGSLGIVVIIYYIVVIILVHKTIIKRLMRSLMLLPMSAIPLPYLIQLMMVFVVAMVMALIC